MSADSRTTSRQQGAGVELDGGGVQAFGDGVEEAAGSSSGLGPDERKSPDGNEQAVQRAKAKIGERLFERVLAEPGAQQRFMPSGEDFELMAAPLGRRLAVTHEP